MAAKEMKVNYSQRNEKKLNYILCNLSIRSGCLFVPAVTRIQMSLYAN